MSQESGVTVLSYSTAHLPPEERYDDWLRRDWPRQEPIYRTAPTEPFDVLMESVLLRQVLLVRTEITAMTWERRRHDIKDSDFQPVIVSAMVRGEAEGDCDGRPFHEREGTYHFHDLARPSLHGSTASLTYSLVLSRDLASSLPAQIERLHGLVVDGAAARALIDLCEAAWSMLPDMTTAIAHHIEDALLAVLAAGVEKARPSAPERKAPDEVLRSAAVRLIDEGLGLQRATTLELSRALGVPAKRLADAFRPDGGLQGYVLGRRLEAARAALVGLARPEAISEVAHRLGFSDAAHLSRAFKKRFGVSPRDYRRNHRASPDLADD